MIHEETQQGADAILETIELAIEMNQLPAVLPDALQLLSAGMFIALREMQIRLVDQELS